MCGDLAKLKATLADIIEALTLATLVGIAAEPLLAVALTDDLVVSALPRTDSCS